MDVISQGVLYVFIKFTQSKQSILVGNVRKRGYECLENSEVSESCPTILCADIYLAFPEQGVSSLLSMGSFNPRMQK